MERASGKVMREGAVRVVAKGASGRARRTGYGPSVQDPRDERQKEEG